MQSNHYLLHFRTIFECPRGSNRVPKSNDFRYAASHGPLRRPRRPPKTLHESPIGEPCASQRSPWDPHGPLADVKVSIWGLPRTPFARFWSPSDAHLPHFEGPRGIKIGESSVHARLEFSLDSDRRVHSRTEHARKEIARAPSVHCTVLPRILAAEYTAGLNMPGKKWREFRLCTLLFFLEFRPQSTQQD